MKAAKTYDPSRFHGDTSKQAYRTVAEIVKLILVKVRIFSRFMETFPITFQSTLWDNRQHVAIRRFGKVQLFCGLCLNDNSLLQAAVRHIAPMLRGNAHMHSWLEDQ